MTVLLYVDYRLCCYEQIQDTILYYIINYIVTTSVPFYSDSYIHKCIILHYPTLSCDNNIHTANTGH